MIIIDQNKLSELKKENCKSKAKELLQNSDWSEIQSVVQQLENSIEWVNYRIAVRQYIINPVEEPNFPQEPQTIWKT